LPVGLPVDLDSPKILGDPVESLERPIEDLPEEKKPEFVPEEETKVAEPDPFFD